MSETIYITVDEVIEIHERMVESTGGSHGLRDRNRLESAVMLPQQTFDQVELYPTIIEKAAILGFAIIANHPFVDGNKRTGQHVMEIFLELNGYEIQSTIDEDEAAIIAVASGQWHKTELIQWLEDHVIPIQPSEWH
jgi:death-on-curing protein